MRRPLVVVMLLYTAGLMFGRFWPLSLTGLFVCSFLILFAVVAVKQLRPVLICLFLFLLGWTSLILHTAVISPTDLRSLVGKAPILATIRGQLAETPHLKIIERKGQETEHSLAEVCVTGLQTNADWQPAFGKILVSTPDAPAEDYFTGQNVEISGVLAPPSPPLASGLFDYPDYLRTRGIFYELKAQSTNDWQLGAPALTTPPIADRFLTWAKHALALGLPSEDEPLRLLWAMTLGWRTAFTGDISDPFLQAGTMHMFAIDGLRIALLSGILVTLMRVFQISRAWCGAVAIPLIWFYTAATGWQSSALRASLMMTIVLGGWALKRPGDLLNSLALAAFIILLCQPLQLFEASFQLSFLVMLTIALMLPPLNDFTDRWLRHDPLLPDELVGGVQKTLLWLGRRFARYASLSFAAWVGSIPLSIKYFHLFSLVSTPANLLAIPLGAFALMANLGALLTEPWLPHATELFNYAAWGFMSAMTWVSVKAASLPAAYWYVPDIGWFAIGIYYTVVIAFFGGWLKTRRSKLFAGVALALVAAVYCVRWEQSRLDYRLTILPLNGGHAIFMAASSRTDAMLIDCGNEQAAQGILKGFLHARGINTIPQLILTTGEVRNSGGALALDQIFHIRQLWTSPANFHSTRYRETIANFDAPPVRRKTATRGDHIGPWTVLYPDPASATNPIHADDAALVLSGQLNQSTVLLLSDLSRTGQNRLLDHPDELHADIVVAGLPAEGEPLSDTLIDAIQPRAIIVADSEFPSQRRASRELHERLERHNIPIFYTRDAGVISLVTEKEGWRLDSVGGTFLKSSRD